MKKYLFVFLTISLANNDTYSIVDKIQTAAAVAMLKKQTQKNHKLFNRLDWPQEGKELFALADHRGRWSFQDGAQGVTFNPTKGECYFVWGLKDGSSFISIAPHKYNFEKKSRILAYNIPPRIFTQGTRFNAQHIKNALKIFSDKETIQTALSAGEILPEDHPIYNDGWTADGSVIHKTTGPVFISRNFFETLKKVPKKIPKIVDLGRAPVVPNLAKQGLCVQPPYSRQSHVDKALYLYFITP